MEQRIILPPGRGDGSHLTPCFVTARLADAAGPALVASDFHLNPDIEQPPVVKLRPASVLIPLIDHGDHLTLLLTTRTDHLAQHAGQIAFPGGRQEPEDNDEIATALRETEEELGIPRDRVRVIGRLGSYVTRTHFAVTPVVGLLHPPLDLSPDPYEVADVFEVPLDFVLDPANHQRHFREMGGIRRYFYAIPWQDRYIWGATAGMLVSLSHVLAPP